MSAENPLGIFAASAAATGRVPIAGWKAAIDPRSASRLMFGAAIGAAWSRLEDDPDDR